MFGLHRGGSSITARLLQLLTAGAGYRLVDEASRYYQAGYRGDDIPRAFYDTMEPSGVFYGPFREYPATMRLVDLSALSRIVVARDPRDCLVSAYFAWRGVHDSADRQRMLAQLPTQREAEETIDDYCARGVTEVRERLDSLRRLCLQYPDTLVFRYEDVFADPPGWLDHVIARLGLVVPPAARDQARLEAVFQPPDESPGRHHRQGRPGDHHRKLSPPTRLLLTEILSEQLRFFGYVGERAVAPPPPAPATEPAAAEEVMALKRIIAELQKENGFRINEIATLRDRLAVLAERLDAPRGAEPRREWASEHAGERQ
jgi:hypothetical protein